MTEQRALHFTKIGSALPGAAFEALAAHLRAARAPLFAQVFGSDRRGDAGRLLATLRLRGFQVQSGGTPYSLPEVGDEVLVAFSHGHPPAAALLLPAVQSARLAARRHAGATSPAFGGGVRVAAGDVNGDWQLLLVTLRRTGRAQSGGEHEFEYDLVAAR